MINLLLKDFENMTCQHMKFLSSEKDDLITNNVVEMCNSEMNVQIETVELTIPENEINQKGWGFDDGLYEKLLFKYTEIEGKVLTRWK